MIQFDEDKQNLKLKQLREKEEEDVVRILSEKYGIPYADLTTTSTNIDALRLVPEQEARAAQVAPFDLAGKRVAIGVRSTEHPQGKAVVEQLKKDGYTPELYLVSTRSLESVFEHYADLSHARTTTRGLLDVSSDDVTALMTQVTTEDDATSVIKETLAMKKEERISRIVEVVLASALATNASDVHIEPEERAVRLRFRLNGILTDLLDIDVETYKLLLSRIKLLSGLKLNVQREPQDGRFSINVGETEVEVRTSTLPGEYGEAIVMRVLNPETLQVPLEELGLEPGLLAAILREIAKPNGMVLSTGPTGSGKTTTLYAFLRRVHTPDVKIITIEDPIEYHLEGIVQTQVDRAKKYTFSGGLRASLRQDPDVIMVGEVRDAETAEIAINAALTGHLVFSTLHTNSAAGTFPRLIDLGVNPKTIGSAVNMALAQRLVRTVCGACAKRVPLAGADAAFVAGVLESIADPKKREGVISDNVMQAVGCPECGETGYKGRIGVFEAIVVDDAVESVIRESPSERDVAKAALPQGLLTMVQDGVLKALAGTTTLEEVQRVVASTL